MKRYTFYVKYKTKEEQLEAVKENGYSIRYMHNPDKELQLEAVKRNGYSIRYIHNPDKEVQLEAAKETGNSIQYMHILVKHLSKIVKANLILSDVIAILSGSVRSLFIPSIYLLS